MGTGEDVVLPRLVRHVGYPATARREDGAAFLERRGNEWCRHPLVAVLLHDGDVSRVGWSVEIDSECMPVRGPRGRERSRANIEKRLGRAAAVGGRREQ